MIISNAYQDELLTNSWKRCWEDVFGTPETDLRDSIIWHYSDPSRHYHNISHLIGSLQIFKEYRNLPLAPNRVELAIWLHDVIYNPYAKDNELESVRFLYDYLFDQTRGEEVHTTNHQTSRIFAEIERLIQATTHNNNDPFYDAYLICDIDLVTLGADDTTFNSYCAKIRDEYKRVPDKDYYKGRLAILHDFLDRGFIYRTDPFKKKYERKATTNLLMEIERIKSVYKATMM